MQDRAAEVVLGGREDALEDAGGRRPSDYNRILLERFSRAELRTLIARLAFAGRQDHDIADLVGLDVEADRAEIGARFHGGQ